VSVNNHSTLIEPSHGNGCVPVRATPCRFLLSRMTRSSNWSAELSIPRLSQTMNRLHEHPPFARIVAETDGALHPLFATPTQGAPSPTPSLLIEGFGGRFLAGRQDRVVRFPGAMRADHLVELGLQRIGHGWEILLCKAFAKSSREARNSATFSLASADSRSRLRPRFDPRATGRRPRKREVERRQPSCD
jgi:hypothetical protein